MAVLSVNSLELSFGERRILDNVSFTAEKGDKIGIVGVNGAGKTTLIKILSGELEPDAGSVFVSKECEMGYLKQEDDKIKEFTVYQAVLAQYAHLMDIEHRIKDMESTIGDEKDTERLEILAKRYSDLYEKFKEQGGFEYPGRVKGILKGLGFSEDEFDFPVEKLSGGQRTRLMMARLLSKEPDILLLDEPTNHLDINALNWLEGFLSDYKNTCIVVSHDRYFLDRVCNGIIEVENACVSIYKGNYSAYISKKSTDREIIQRQFENQQKEIKRLEEFIKLQRKWNREHNIVAAESRQKAIDRMEKVEALDSLPGRIRIRIDSRKESGNDVLDVVGVDVSFGSRKILDNVAFSVKKGEKVFITGPNGCGKSTLLKGIMGKLRLDKGEVNLGRHVQMGYYDQEMVELDNSNTLYEEILGLDEKLSQTDIRNALAAFLFKGDDVNKKIAMLSGGEKSRVILTKLILSGPNLIIMDEPTNHLDISSREVLEDALMSFDGTVICVSHDRYFIKKLATRILDFYGEGIFDFKGDYEQYIAYRANYANLLGMGSSGDSKLSTDRTSEAKENYLSSKEEKSRERKQKKMIDDTEKRIHEIEKRLNVIGEEMEQPEVCADHVRLTDLLAEKTSIEEELDNLYRLWMEIH